jgi:hypothetical protein
LLAQKKYEEAEPLLLQGYEGMKQRQLPASARPRLAEALERLVQLYEATNRNEEAAHWRRELEAVRQQAKEEGVTGSPLHRHPGCNHRAVGAQPAGFPINPILLVRFPQAADVHTADAQHPASIRCRGRLDSSAGGPMRLGRTSD